MLGVHYNIKNDNLSIPQPCVRLLPFSLLKRIFGKNALRFFKRILSLSVFRVLLFRIFTNGTIRHFYFISGSYLSCSVNSMVWSREECHHCHHPTFLKWGTVLLFVHGKPQYRRTVVIFMKSQQDDRNCINCGMSHPQGRTEVTWRPAEKQV